MKISSHHSIHELDAAGWNALVDGRSPFLRHEFLAALETHQAVGADSGWLPCYLAAERNGVLDGALPMYIKEHSFGEFVFDWAWAGAHERNGIPYYPKLVVAVPYTPVSGPRILVAPGANDGDAVAEALVDAALDHARRLEVSSLHWLFTTPADSARLQDRGLMMRTDCQFHWTNPGYRDFDDFLSALSSRNRKELRRERRSVVEQGIRVEAIGGADAAPETWDELHRFYRCTFVRKGNHPPLTRGFFRDLGAKLGDQTLLIMARLGGRPVAGALFFLGRDVLYGRHWGAEREFPNLHFELCYYRAIEYCIEHGIQRFEAGAQGEYKVRRGFRPALTRSMHWIADPRFESAIGEYLVRERGAVGEYIEEMHDRLPYRVTA